MNIKSILVLLFLGLSLSAQAGRKVYNAVVDIKGHGDYRSVQAAIDAVPEQNLNQYLIYIKAGTYREHVFIPLGKDHISLIGEGCDRVFITDNKKNLVVF